MKYSKLLLFGLLLWTVACKNPEKPVTKEQAAQLSSSIAKSIAKGDKTYLDNVFDTEALIDRIKASAKDKPSDYWKGLKEAVTGRMDFGDKIIEAIGRDGSYQLVKQYEKEGKQHLLFRIYSASGINYHDFELVNKGDQTKVADVYIYTTGEHFSSTLKDLFSGMLDMKDREAMEKAKDLTRLRSMMQRGDYKEAKEIIDALPFNMRSVKAVQIYNIQVCSQLGDSIHRDAIDKYTRDFPNDPSLDLVLIDGYFLQKKYNEALACVERLDKRINTDPMLDYYRGLIYNLLNKKEEAEKTYERLYKNMPEFSAGAVELSTYYMDKGEYEKAATLLKKIKTNKDYDESMLSNLYILYPKMSEYMK